MKDSSNVSVIANLRKKKKNTNAVSLFCPFFPLSNFFGMLRFDNPNSAAIPNARRPR